MNEVLFNNDAQDKIIAGVNKVANAVKLTLGPKGRNAIIRRDGKTPLITNDGITIANSISDSDAVINMGCEIARDSASKTNKTAGDGTTTTIVLEQAFIKAGKALLDNGRNAMDLRRDLEKASKQIIDEIKARTVVNPSASHLKAIATISVESEEIGGAIASLFTKIGKDGVVDTIESDTPGVIIDHTDGMEIRSQYMTSYFDDEYKDIPVLVTDNKISSAKDIFPLIEKLKADKKDSLAIFCEEIDSSILAALIKNKMAGIFNTLVVKVNVFHKKDELNDIAAYLGAEFISQEKSMSLQEVNLSRLGLAKVIKTKKESTVIFPATTDNVIEYVKKLQEDADKIVDSWDKNKAVERIARIMNGVATIKVGAQTETEMRYLKLKIEDAVNATRAAIQEGIVIGGGTTLYQIADKYPDNILSEAIRTPFLQILDNAGVDKEGIVEMVKKGYTYNAKTGTIIQDALEEGIIDPSKVTQNAVNNAASLAGILLTTAVSIS